MGNEIWQQLNSIRFSPGKSEHFLLHLVPAVLDDPLHLLVHQLDAPDARLLQPSDLPLDEQLERHLRHEEGGAWAGGVADRRQDVHGGEAGQRADGVQSPAERLVEDVADASAAATRSESMSNRVLM